MKRKLVVDVKEAFLDMAVLEDDKLVEYHRLDCNASGGVSNVYKAKVKNVVKGMSAAFLDIGTDRNGYLRLEEDQKVAQGQEILVQIMKPPYKEKGAVLTTNISLPGKYVVLKLYDRLVYVSRKIDDEKIRKDLKSFAIKERGSSYGLIIRTEAVAATKEELLEDIHRLQEQWEKIDKYHPYRTAPSVIYQEPSPLIKFAKDRLHDDTEMVINDKGQYTLVNSYLEQHYPEMVERVRLYEDEWHIFNLYKIGDSLEKALRPKVWLKSGASVVIEPTEALVSIDVNSSKFTGKKNIEDTITKVNLEACKEIARQVRLRNLSGIIIIDFIDMKDEDNQIKVIEGLKEAFRSDPVKTVVLGMTRLGLVEMTRKKTAEPLYLQLK